MGSIDENALNALSLVVELTKHIKTKSEKDAESAKAEKATRDLDGHKREP